MEAEDAKLAAAIAEAKANNNEQARIEAEMRQQEQEATKLELKVLIEKNEASKSGGKSLTGVKGHWITQVNTDMPKDGDIQTIKDWRKQGKTLNDLKKMVEKKKWSAICIGTFPDAYLKSFAFQLKPNNTKKVTEDEMKKGKRTSFHIWVKDKDPGEEAQLQ